MELSDLDRISNIKQGEVSLHNKDKELKFITNSFNLYLIKNKNHSQNECDLFLNNP